MGRAPVTIFVDAMGGDRAPYVNIRGAVLALKETDATIVLVGDEKQINPLLQAEERHIKPGDRPRLKVTHTDEFIAMDDHAATAVRSKKNASMNVAMRLAAETPHSAFLSAGNSGAAMASAVMNMKRIPGVERPAIAATLPATKGFFLLIDAGANTQVRPSQLTQFALMGASFFRSYFPGTKGTIGVLSNGGEESKGTDLTRETNEILKQIQEAGLIPAGTYKGYVEGRQLFEPKVDVVVCDGFTGNILLKGFEGLAGAMLEIIRSEVKRDWLSKIGMIFAMGALKKVKGRMDYAEVGGAPLIGVNGHAFISHGGSTPKAIKNAIRKAAEAASQDIPGALKDIIQKTKGHVSPAGAQRSEENE